MDEEGVVSVPHNVLHLLVRRDWHGILCCVELRLEVQEVRHWDECNTPGLNFLGVLELPVLVVRVVITFIVGDGNLLSFEEQLQPLYLIFHFTCIRQERLSDMIQVDSS